MDANATGSPAHPGTEFEQAGAQSFDLRRAPRRWQLQPEQIDQVVGESVQPQAEGIGQEAMAAQPVSTETVLELLDAVLALAAVLVKGEDLGSAGRGSW